MNMVIRPTIISIEGFSADQIGYHCLLLGEAGLIQASEISSMGSISPTALPIRLTCEGHEFIENVQNDKIWGQTKEAVAKLGDVSFAVWSNVLTKIVISNLGLSS